MKRLLFILPLLISFICFGQIQPPFQTLGNSGNEVKTLGIGSAHKGFALRLSYPDTISANNDLFLKNIRGVQFRSADTIWQRSNDLTRWFRAGGGSVYIDSTNTITLAGNGSDNNPLTATLKSSQVSGNAVQIFADGLYVASSIEEGRTDGGIITWVSGYTYEVSPVEFNIGGIPYEAPFSTVTLSNADPTNDRIDVIAATISGTVVVITGTPAANPLKPSINPATQVELGFVLVTANTVQPVVPPTQDWIYINNTEWTTAASTARINPNSTTNPYSVTKDIEGTLVQNNDNIRFTAITPPTISNFNIITFKIRSKAVWASDSRIGLQWYNASAVATGVEVPLSSGAFGFVSNQLSTYQIVSISLAQFGALVNPTNLLMTIRTTAGRTIGFYIDDIQLQSGEIPVAGNFYAQNGNDFGATGVLGMTSNNHQTFITNNIERMRIDSSGRVMIGTVGPSYHGLLVKNAIRADSLRMNALIMSESGSTTTFDMQGFNLTTNYGSNGTATHNFINGVLQVNRVAPQPGGVLAGFSQTSAGMGTFYIGDQSANASYSASVGTVNGYSVGTAAYNTFGAIILASGTNYGIALNFNNQSAASNPNALWLHSWDGTFNQFPFTLKKTGQFIFGNYGGGSFTAGTPAYGLAVTSNGTIIETAVGGTYTATNGLNLTGSAFGLGGTLTGATTILNNGNNLTVTRTGSGYTLILTSTTGSSLRSTTTDGYGLDVRADGDGIPSIIRAVPTSTNTVVPMMQIQRQTSSTAATGIGGSIDIWLESSSGGVDVSTQLISKYTDVAPGTKTAQFEIWNANNGAAAARVMAISGAGTVTLDGAAYVGLGAGYIAVSNTGVLSWASATGSMTNPMTTTADMIYSSSGSTPARLGIGTAGQVLTVSGGFPVWVTPGVGGSVTSVAAASTGIFSYTGSPITTSGTLTLVATGTSGGIPYFSAGTTLTSSAVLAANAIVIGGGAGVAPSTITTGTGVITALGINIGSAGAFTTFNGAHGTPSSITLTNGTGLPISTGLTGAGTGVLAALAVNIGSAGAFVTFNGALGTPSSGTISTGVTLGDVTMNVTGTDATGDIYYRSAGGLLTRLAIGTSGQIIRVSAGGIPEYFTSAGTGTVTSVATTQPASGFTVTGGPITTSGTLVFTLNNDLLGVENLATTGIVRRTGTNTWTAGTLVSLTTEVTGTLPVANGGTNQTTYTNGQLLIGNTSGNTLTKATLTAGVGISITNGTGSITIATTFNPTVQTLTYGATTTWNVANGGNANLTLTASGTSLVITNPVAGMTYTIKIIQGSGGNKTVGAWPSGTAWPAASGAPVLSTTAGDVDIIVLYFDGTNYYGDYKYDMTLTYFDAIRKHRIVPMYSDEENYQIAA